MVTNGTGKLVDTNFFTANSNLLNQAIGPMAGGASVSLDPGGFNTNGGGQVSSQPTLQTVTNNFAQKTNAVLTGPTVMNMSAAGFITNGGAGTSGGTTNAGTNTFLSTARTIYNGTYVLNGALFGSGTISIGGLTSTGTGTIDGNFSVLGSSSLDNGLSSTDGSGDFTARKFSATATPGFTGDISGATGVPAGQLSGTVPTGNLGSGTANGGAALYGDQTYKVTTNATPGTNIVIASGAVSVGAAVVTNFDVNNRNLNGALAVGGLLSASNSLQVTGNSTASGANQAATQFSTASQYGVGLGDYLRPYDNFGFGYGSVWGITTAQGANSITFGNYGSEGPATYPGTATAIPATNGMPKGLLVTNSLGGGAYVGVAGSPNNDWTVADTNSQIWSFLACFGGSIVSNTLWVAVTGSASATTSGFMNGTNNTHSYGFTYTSDQGAGNNDAHWCAFTDDFSTATNRVDTGLTPATGTNAWLFTMVKTGSNIVYYVATNALSPAVCVATNHYLSSSPLPVAWQISDYSADNTKYGQVIFYEAYHQMVVGR